MSALPIRLELICQELTTSRDSVDLWLDRINNGIPSVDLPGSDEQYYLFLIQLANELLVVSDKLEMLAARLLPTS